MEKPNWTFHFKNYGLSPAVNFRIDKHLAIGENAIRQVRWYEIPVKKGGGILAPTEVNFDTAFSEQALNPERQAALAKINGGYVVFGHFEYSDISEPDGSPYVSQFCFYHLSNNAVHNCGPSQMK